MKNLRHLPLLCAAVCAALLLLPARGLHAQATATPPGKMSYQGFLTDVNGVPLGNATPINTNIIFRIWKSASGTATTDKLWSELQVVTIDKGYFTVLLGEGSAVSTEASINAANLSGLFIGADASDRFVEMTLVATGSTTGNPITPRTQLLPAPYAMLAMSARQVVDNGGNAVLTATGGNVTFAGNITGNNFTGNGANLTSLNANNLSSGTVPNGRLSGTYSEALTLNNAANSFAGNGAGLFGFTASQIPNLDTTKLTTGILPISRGGTGSGSQNFVDLSTQQTYIRGNKSFFNYVAINGNWDTVPRQALDVFGSAIISGSVGIGTINPTKGKLEVSGYGTPQSYSGTQVDYFTYLTGC